MPSWDWHSPDWTEGTFERDERRAREYDRLEDELVREQDLVDLLRERGSSLSGRAASDGHGRTGLPERPREGKGNLKPAARPESDEKEAA